MLSYINSASKNVKSMQPDIQNMENRETTEQSILKQLDMLTRIWQEKEVSRKGSLT